MQTALPLTHIRFALFLVLALAATLLVTTAPHVAGAHAAFTGKPLPAPRWQSAFDFRLGASFYDRMLDCPNSFTVDDPGDTADASAGNGLCANSSGKCTLRAAIEEANALTSCSPLTINFSVTGTISLATALPNLNHPNLTISGPGASNLTVQRSTASGTAEFRVFTINSDKVMAISGLTVSNGKLSSTNSGSGILNGGTLSLTDCVVSGNTGAYFGGGILSFASLTVTRCTISDNTATAGGGGIGAFSTFVMSDSTVSGNIGGTQGGGLELENVTATLTNCTISGNTSTAGNGGAIHNLGTNNLLTLDNCTITENTGSRGAGIRTNATAGAVSVTTRLKNTLVANNTGNNFATNGSGAVLILESNDLDSDGTSRATGGVKGNLVGTAAKKINALLFPLGNYGGTTQTHALLPGSPAINAGTSSGAPTGDQRGSSRVGAVDIGAFESQGFTLAVTSGNNQSATVSTAFASALAVSVSSSFGEPVNGGQVTFTQPASGASATITGSPASLDASGQASVTARANSMAGGYNVAASASGAPAVNFSLTNTCQTITVTAPAANTGKAGAAFSAAFTQSGGIGATTFSTASALPTGITLSTAGVLAGTPVQTGSFPITVTATDTNGCTGTASYTLTINCQSIAVTTPATNTSTAGAGFSQTFTQTGGIGTTTFSTASALPAGLTLSTGGVLSGIPTQTGTFPVTVTATDSNGCMNTAGYTLSIGCQTITVTAPATNSAILGAAFSQTFTQSGGSGTTTFGTASSLPTGLTLSTGGALSGTPTQSGTFPITVTATDSNGCTGTTSYTLTVGCVISLTVNDLGDASDANVGNGVCADASGKCTLRAAIEEANALTSCSPLTINFSVTGTISLATALPNLNHPNLTVNGPGASSLTVQRSTASGTANFRIFSISSGKTVAISGLTIANGYVSTLGGGIMNFGSLTITGCAIRGNYADAGGGIFSSNSAILNMSNSTLSGNSAGFDGAGMYNNNGTASLTNCTISANTSVGGGCGGIESLASSGFSASLSLTNCTVTGNSGSKIIELYILSSGIASTVQLRNTLVAGNSGKNFEFPGSAQVTSLGNNLDSDGTSGFINGANGNLVGRAASKLNALLSELGNYGGTTQTHALLPGSPAINAGTSSGATASDQRGSSRAGAVDIGAVESQGFTLMVSGGNNQSAMANTNFANPLAVTATANVASEPVNGGQVTFAPPASGASATLAGNPASIASGVAATGTVKANALVGGPYIVAASANGAAAVNFSLTNACPTITVTAPAINSGTAGAAFSQTFTQTGGSGTTTFSTSSALPAGIMLSTAGLLSGTPTQSGTFPIIVTATDANGCTGSTGYTLKVITCPTLFTVNDLGDTSDANAGDGVCADSNGKCTLRAAVEEAVVITACAPLTIHFSLPGTITLATELPSLNHPNLTITGLGTTSTIVQAAASAGIAAYRVFRIGAGRTVAIENLTVRYGVSPSGGGINISGGRVTLNNVAVSDNQSTSLNGGGISVNDAISFSASLTLNNCTISNNQSANNGGGIYIVADLPVALNNSTVSGNSAQAGGGGIYINRGSANLNYSTVANNTSDSANSGTGDGGGLYRNGGSIYLKSSIVAGNKKGAAGIADAAADCGGTIISQNYNLTGSGTGCSLNGTGDRTVAPATVFATVLGPLSDNGGPTQTMALWPGSPAIDAGDGTAATDQRGVARPQGSALDIGAFESRGFTLAITGGNNQTTGLSTAFSNALAVSVSSSFGEPVSGGQVIFTPPVSGASADVAGNPATIASGTATSGAVTANTILGTYNVAASANGASPVSFSLTNGCQTIAVMVPATNTGTLGASFSQTFTQLGGISPITFSTASTLPTGLTLSTSGVLSGTPTQTGSFPITVTVSSGGGCTGTASYVLTIGCPVITLSPLAAGTAGTAYNQTVTASPTGGGYSFAMTSGSLPPGLSLSTGGALTGTPTMVGTFNFTIRATGFGGCTGSQAYSLVINCPAITLSPVSLPNAAVNSPYSQTVNAAPSGTAYSFSVTSGALPTGLTLNSSTGEISGSATQSGTFNFRVAAVGWGNCTGFRDYSLAVGCAAVTVNPSSLPGGSIGASYSQGVSALPAGTYSYTVSSGALPAGLMLNAATGAITGTPAASGSYNFTITASAGGCSGSRGYTLAIGCQTISFTATSLPAGTTGSSYLQTLTVTPSGAHTFSLAQGSLPSGLMLNTATGVISGLPSVTGTYNFTVKAQTASGCSATQVFSLAINCPSLMLMPATLPGGTTGTAYNQTITVSPSGGIYSFAVTSGVLPTGLTLNAGTGALSGTPAVAGTFDFTVTATGVGSCAGSKPYTVVISGGGCPTIALPANLPGGSTGQLYNNSVAASPSGSYSYTFTGSLPPGVALYGSFGLLYGFPTANGTYNFTVTATGANNCSASQSYAVVIGAGSLQVVNDFSGDQKSDFVLWRAAQNQWLIVDSATNAAQAVQWGQAGDRAVAGDYDGDGKADLAAFSREGGKDGHWRVRLSGGGTLDKVWGLGSDVPVPGDYDGDGKTDLAVWRGAESGWYIQRSSDGQTQSVQWGTSLAPYLDVPVPGDYDGDGQTDVAVFRQANGHWYIRRSSDGQTVDKAWGLGTDVPVPGDYDGDGQTDIAIWRGSQGDWYIVRSSDGTVESKFWGAATAPYFDVPAVGDYDGDGKADVAVWRKSDAHWYVQYSSDGATRMVAQGRSGDQPVTATPRR